jgi:prephenate dehydrogenase
MSTAGIVGLGLIGGSLARDLAAAGWTVLGEDQHGDVIDQARTEGVIAGPLAPARLDLLVLAVPVRAAPAWLDRLAPDLRHDAVVTDVGSTKATIGAAAGRVGLGERFVGSHPMAGDHRSGWSAARPGLFRGADVWICPGEAVADAVTRVEGMWRQVGARPEHIDAAEHDRLMAWASHLPQIAATALADALARADVGRDRLGPGGRDATRLAASDPTLWVDILRDNAAAVIPAIDGLARSLSAARDALKDDDEAALRELLEGARRWSGVQRLL